MQKIILFLHSSRTNLGATQPSAQWVQEGLVLGGEVNRPTRGVGNLPLNSAEIKKRGVMLLFPQYAFIALTGNFFHLTLFKNPS